MIKDNQKYFNRLQVVLDALVIAFSYWLSWVAKFMLPFFGKVEKGALPFVTYMQLLILIVPCYLILYYGCGLYTPKRVQGRRLEFANIAKGKFAGVFKYHSCVVYDQGNAYFTYDAWYFSGD